MGWIGSDLLQCRYEESVRVGGRRKRVLRRPGQYLQHAAATSVEDHLTRRSLPHSSATDPARTIRLLDWETAWSGGQRGQQETAAVRPNGQGQGVATFYPD
jgi:hypothetical protein